MSVSFNLTNTSYDKKIIDLKVVGNNEGIFVGQSITNLVEVISCINYISEKYINKKWIESSEIKRLKDYLWENYYAKNNLDEYLWDYDYDSAIFKLVNLFNDELITDIILLGRSCANNDGYYDTEVIIRIEIKDDSLNVFRLNKDLAKDLVFRDLVFFKL